MFPANAFDTATLGVLTRALEDAWIAVQSALGVTPLNPDQLKSRLANRIIAAADKGERDPKRLPQELRAHRQREVRAWPHRGRRQRVHPGDRRADGRRPINSGKFRGFTDSMTPRDCSNEGRPLGEAGGGRPSAEAAEYAGRVVISAAPRRGCSANT